MYFFIISYINRIYFGHFHSLFLSLIPVLPTLAKFVLAKPLSQVYHLVWVHMWLNHSIGVVCNSVGEEAFLLTHDQLTPLKTKISCASISGSEWWGLMHPCHTPMPQWKTERSFLGRVIIDAVSSWVQWPGYVQAPSCSSLMLPFFRLKRHLLFQVGEIFNQERKLEKLGFVKHFSPSTGMRNFFKVS